VRIWISQGLSPPKPQHHSRRFKLAAPAPSQSAQLEWSLGGAVRGGREVGATGEGGPMANRREAQPTSPCTLSHADISKIWKGCSPGRTL
jgi:hypothetical protein